MKINLSISQLIALINNAEEAKRNNEFLSSTIEIEILKKSDTHTGTDKIIAELKSVYAECIGTYISDQSVY